MGKNGRQYGIPILATSALKDENYIKSLNILDFVKLAVDDCFFGTYEGVTLNIVEAETTVWRGIIVCTAFILFLCLPIIITDKLNFYLLFLPISVIIALLGYGIYMSAFNKFFRGIFVEIDMNKKFEGHTFILEKDDYRNKAAAKLQGYELVKLEDPEFERQYAVYSQSQIESRYILTPSFMERIKAIKDTYKAKYVRVSFKDEKIVVAIHTGRDMFKMAGTKNMTKETFLQLFNEIVSVLDLVETLKLNQILGL